MNVKFEEVEEFVADRGDGAICVYSIVNGRADEKGGRKGTIFDAEKEFEGAVCLITNWEGDILELASRVRNLRYLHQT